MPERLTDARIDELLGVMDSYGEWIPVSIGSLRSLAEEVKQRRALECVAAADPEYGLQALAAEVERLQEPVKVTGMMDSLHATTSAKHDDCHVFSFAGLRPAYCPQCGRRLEWK